MSKAEIFIKENTRYNSNEYWDVHCGNTTRPWLSPDDTRKAVEIAREEIYEWLKDNIHMYNGECEGDRKGIINDLKQAMKDEYDRKSS